eukprot:m.238834 g.238834  ORF g.238834 m.238834 type:complete len:64 (+) comp22513_c2_seq12:2020-2211(+)
MWLALSLLALAAVAHCGPVVNTTLGPIEGVQNEDGFHEFLGIPFAQAGPRKFSSSPPFSSSSS